MHILQLECLSPLILMILICVPLRTSDCLLILEAHKLRLVSNFLAFFYTSHCTSRSFNDPLVKKKNSLTHVLAHGPLGATLVPTSACPFSKPDSVRSSSRSMSRMVPVARQIPFSCPQLRAYPQMHAAYVAELEETRLTPCADCTISRNYWSLDFILPHRYVLQRNRTLVLSK